MKIARFKKWIESDRIESDRIESDRIESDRNGLKQIRIGLNASNRTERIESDRLDWQWFKSIANAWRLTFEIGKKVSETEFE